MEAANLNQMHDDTSQMAEREISHEETKNEGIELQQYHIGITAQFEAEGTSRIGERDAQMTVLKEKQFEVEEATSDKATDAHRYQAQDNEYRRELSEAKRALQDASQTESEAVTAASDLERENNELKKQLQTYQEHGESEVIKLYRQLAELQSINSSLSTQIVEEKLNNTKIKQLNSKEISNLRSTLRARDDAMKNLRGRVDKAQGELAAMETELDELRGEKEKILGENEEAMSSLRRENEDMSKLVEEQNNALNDMKAKWERQEKECDQQSLMAERRGAEIKRLQLALEEGELEKEAAIVHSNSLSEQNNEKMDELTSTLNDAMEEISNLQADAVFKEGQITSLEKEIEEASRLSKANVDEGLPSRPHVETANITHERDQLESENKLQLPLLETSKDGEISTLGEDLENSHSQNAPKESNISKLQYDLGEARRQLKAETEKVATLAASLASSERFKAKLSHELEEARVVIDHLDAEKDRELEETKDRELARAEAYVGGESKEARQALVPLDPEGRSPGRNHDDGYGEKTGAIKQAPSDESAALGKRIRVGKAELRRTVREQELIISDLNAELASKEKNVEVLKDEIESLRLSVERGPSKKNYKEQDAVIANLLQSTQANEEVIANLRADSERVKSKLKESKEENRRLQHYSEIFSAHIIDQEEEFRSFEARIRELEAGIRDVELKKVEEDGFEAERLKLELQNAIDDKEATEESLNEQIDSLRKLRDHAVEDFESKLQERDDQIASLEKELIDLGEKVWDDDLDEIFLDDKSRGGTGESKKQLLEEREMLLDKIVALGDEIESLRAPEDSEALSQLESKLAQSERLREELEEDWSSKDEEMDRLRMQLSEAREALTSRELERSSLLKKLEAENSEIQSEFTALMKEKNAEIMALEQTLAAQEQVVGNMSSEMDHLQNSMEKVSAQRRAEVEEMQQELMDHTSKSAQLEREVMALSMKLDEKKMKHEMEMARLRDRIATLESETPLERIAQRDDHDVGRCGPELEEKIDHLNWLNSSLKEENEKLKEKMDSLKKAVGKDKKDESPSPKFVKNNDKWRNVALQEQVSVLSQRVIELEEAAAGTSAAAASQSGRPDQSPRPSVSHSPGMQSSLEKRSLNGAARSSLVPKSESRVSPHENNADQANDLLLNVDMEQPQENTRTAGTPAPLPRPPPGSNMPKSLEKSKNDGSKPSPRFSFRKRSSKGLFS